MLPKNVQLSVNKIPLNNNDKEIIKVKEQLKKLGYKNKYINSLFLSQEKTINALEKIGISRNTSFYEFYLNGFGFPNILKGEELLSLEQITDYYKEPYMLEELKDKYPKASKKFIQFTSIEGGGSYFYDNQTDAVYDVTWGQEEDMINGIMEPWFTSFYDFLEWYYSEEEN
jgi:hypothetical protein